MNKGNALDSASIEISLATAQDLENIETCARKAYAQYVEKIGREPAPMTADFSDQIERGHIHVARYRSAFTGFVVFYQINDNLQLENIAVSPHWTGNGIGRKLIEFAEATARDTDLIAVTLYTNEAMTENLKMYSRLGYIETERKKQDGFARVFYRKSVR